MSRYNQKVKRTVETVTNHQGGTGVKYDPKLELIAILSTGIDNTYYEKLSDREKRFSELIDELSKKDIEFVAKALVYARSVVGQRSVTHFGSVSLVKHLSGSAIGKRFFSKRDKNGKTGGIVYRLDDVLEIIAAYQHFNPGKPLPNSMKKGFKMALESADAYELAKYQGKGKAVSLVDVVNLVRPKPTTPQMEGVFKDLMSGKLKQFNTVEDKNSKAGQDVAAKVKSGEITKAQAEVELTQAKESNYAELIATRKIGYMALLRNLRNIIQNGANPELIKGACDLLMDEKLIRKSLVFPHQIDIALEILLQEVSASSARPFVTALNKAYELAIPNLVELFSHGRTAVVIDTSGSMHGGYGSYASMNGKKINANPIDKAALIGATLAKGIGADLYQFSSSTEEIRYNPGDSINTIKNICLNQQGRVGHGTDFGSIFTRLQSSGKYDRIFIISDLQGGDRIVTNSPFQTYKSKHGEPFIYTVDIQGYGTTMFKPGNKLVQLFGYSADIYEMIKKAEIDPKAILKEIEAIVI
jgi:hypothetical protein